MNIINIIIGSPEQVCVNHLELKAEIQFLQKSSLEMEMKRTRPGYFLASLRGSWLIFLQDPVMTCDSGYSDMNLEAATLSCREDVKYRDEWYFWYRMALDIFTQDKIIKSGK